MPIFTFNCPECGEFEVIEPSPTVYKERTGVDLYLASAEVPCENCGLSSTKDETLATSSFVLKGTGWHSTDYR